MRKVHAGLAIAAALCLGTAIAQERPAPRPAAPLQPLQQPLVGGQALSPMDQQIAACIYLACRNEIEVAKFAQEKVQSEAVRAFAEKMIREHTPDCEAYQKLAGNLAAPHHEAGDHGPAAPGAPPAAATPRVGVEIAPRAAGTPPAVGVNVGGRIAGGAGGPADWAAIHRELAEQCLASTKQELGRHQGTEFEQCFMGQQFGAHMKMADELKVLKKHAGPQLASQIDKSSQVVQTHLQEARQLMEKLKGNPSERVTRKPEGNP